MKASPTGAAANYATQRLEIVYLPIHELKPDERNPRTHSKKKIRQLARCIDELGFNSPVLIDRDGNVVAGNARLLAARELGRSMVPTICLDHLNEAQICAFKIADNRLAEIATWDDRLLAQELRALSMLDLDFNLELTGWDMGEIDLRLASRDSAPAEDEPTDADLEPAADPLSKPGDIWQLGEHRVLCGSVLDLAAVQGLMAEERGTMVFTDPPYNVPIEGHVSGLGGIIARSRWPRAR